MILDTDNRLVQVGGNLEDAVKGNYSIDVAEILKEAWQTTKTTKSNILIGLSFVFLIGVISSLITSEFMGGIEAVVADSKSNVILNIVVTIIVWPFLAGIEMMGIYNAVGLNTRPSLVFRFLSRGSWVALTAIFVSSIVSLGLSLFIIPGVYFAIVLSPAVQLVVEKKLSPFTAIRLSVKALTRQQGFSVLSLYATMFGALILSFMPVVLLQSMLPVGLIITLLALSVVIPLFYNIKGIVYREVFGVIVPVNLADAVNEPKSNTFDA